MSDAHDNHNIICQPNSKVYGKKTKTFSLLKKGLSCALLAITFSLLSFEAFYACCLKKNPRRQKGFFSLVYQAFVLDKKNNDSSFAFG